MVRFRLILSLGCLIAVSMCQSNTVCDSTTNLCFEQIFIPTLNVTVGFALPPKKESENFVNEALVLGSFALPYGFAGAVLGEQKTLVESSPVVGLVWYADFVSAAQEKSTPFSIAYCRAEIVTPGSNNTLIPLFNKQFIFRCQNCGIITDYLVENDEIKLTTVISTSYPEYIDTTLTLVNLSLVGAKYQEFTLNTRRAHFSNYSAMLSAAGFA
ncbi:hypothetical protein DFH07DRAFT_839109 [Mycena maculata]|uniref:Uncharacterized protein n=1 Tax=Mycena maculata TaxID=230809 RepID=A0AAD7IDC5_9AGAR|nr:hypothetical protein DFH07DRAFT_839109 [Mycena maculata]